MRAGGRQGVDALVDCQIREPLLQFVRQLLVRIGLLLFLGFIRRQRSESVELLGGRVGVLRCVDDAKKHAELLPLNGCVTEHLLLVASVELCHLPIDAARGHQVSERLALLFLARTGLLEALVAALRLGGLVLLGSRFVAVIILRRGV